MLEEVAEARCDLCDDRAVRVDPKTLGFADACFVQEADDGTVQLERSLEPEGRLFAAKLPIRGERQAPVVDPEQPVGIRKSCRSMFSSRRARAAAYR